MMMKQSPARPKHARPVVLSANLWMQRNRGFCFIGALCYTLLVVFFLTTSSRPQLDTAVGRTIWEASRNDRPPAVAPAAHTATPQPTTLATAAPIQASDSARVLCVILREVVLRPLDVHQPGCHFFDFHGQTVMWRGRRLTSPCSEYSVACLQKKQQFMFRTLLQDPEIASIQYFLLVESDNVLCVDMPVFEQLASAYRPHLMLTGLGGSGLLFSREWAQEFQVMFACKSPVVPKKKCTKRLDVLVSHAKSGKWFSPELQSRIYSSRLRLTSHVIKDGNKGISGKISKRLPRCLENVFSGVFESFNHSACPRHDVYPCDGIANREILLPYN